MDRTPTKKTLETNQKYFSFDQKKQLIFSFLENIV